MIIVDATTLEKYAIPVETTADPTATPPEFSLTLESAQTPGTYSSGAWSGTWTAGMPLDAITPTIGAAGTLALAEGARYRLWVRWTVGAETPVRMVGVIVAT